MLLTTGIWSSVICMAPLIDCEAWGGKAYAHPRSPESPCTVGTLSILSDSVGYREQGDHVNLKKT